MSAVTPQGGGAQPGGPGHLPREYQPMTIRIPIAAAVLAASCTMAVSANSAPSISGTAPVLDRTIAPVVQIADRRVAQRRPVANPGFHRRPAPRRPVNVRIIRRPHGWHGRYWGRVVFGVTLGAVIVVAAHTPPPPPDPALCWTWTNTAQTQGYWYYCSGP